MPELARNWKHACAVLKRADILGTTCLSQIIVCEPLMNHLPGRAFSVLYTDLLLPVSIGL